MHPLHFSLPYEAIASKSFEEQEGNRKEVVGLTTLWLPFANIQKTDSVMVSDPCKMGWFKLLFGKLF